MQLRLTPKKELAADADRSNRERISNEHSARKAKQLLRVQKYIAGEALLESLKNKRKFVSQDLPSSTQAGVIPELATKEQSADQQNPDGTPQPPADSIETLDDQPPKIHES